MPDTEWSRVQSNADAELLLKQFGRFHDSCIHELHLWTDHWVAPSLSMSVSADLDTRVRMVIQRQFKPLSALELVFEEVTRLTVVPSPENYGSEIFEATLLVEDGLIYFADVADWSPKADDQDATWISARD